MNTVYLVRHGETEWNRDRRMQGRRDSPLTTLGQQQARQVGRLLRTLITDPVDCVMVTSPLGRTRQTAALIAAEMGIDVARFALDPQVQEVGWGDWEGMTHAEIAAAVPEAWQHFQADRWRVAPPGGESYAELADRARQWLATTKHHETVLLISHGGFSRVLRGHYLSLPPDETLAQLVPQDAVFRLSQGVATRIDAEVPEQRRTG